MEEVQRGVNISYSSQPVYRKYAAENIQLQRHCAQSRIQHKAESVSQSLKCSGKIYPNQKSFYFLKYFSLSKQTDSDTVN